MAMSYRIRLRLLAILILFPIGLLCAEQAWCQRDVIMMGEAGSRRLRLAITDFEVGTEIPVAKSAELAQRFKKILEFSGFVEVIPQAAHLAKRKPGSDIVYDEWVPLNIDLVVQGKLQRETDGRHSLELAAYDITRRRRVSGKRYSPLRENDIESALRRYGDALFEDVTGVAGAFSTKIAFVGAMIPGKPKEIFVSNYDGTNLQQITKDGAIVLSPAWSSDGLKLAFTSYRDGRPQIYLYSFLTKKLVRLTHSKEAGFSGAAWSPDGKLLAFSETDKGKTHIVTARVADGGGKSVLVQGSGLEVEPSYSSDGKFVSFTSGRFGRPHIFVRNLASGKDTRITFAGWYNTSATWRYDDKKLVFAAYDRDIDRYDIMIVNPDGTQMERLTLKQGDNEKPAWSPDGRMILFQSNRAGAGKRREYGLYQMNKDGGSQRKLNLPVADATMPTWGPRLTIDDQALFVD